MQPKYKSGQQPTANSQQPSLYYILDANHRPIPTTNIWRWSEWMDEADRTVADSTIGPVRILTIFLGLDHNRYTGGEPILFETTVYVAADGAWRLDDTQPIWRYADYETAKTGHGRMMQQLMAESR